MKKAISLLFILGSLNIATTGKDPEDDTKPTTEIQQENTAVSDTTISMNDALQSIKELEDNVQKLHKLLTDQ